MAYSGKFMPTNKSKYKGDYNKITYRSSWEHFYMKFLDTHPNIVSWSSEEFIIPYFSNADGKKRRYFMDFWFKLDSGQEFLIEIKPQKETAPPKPPAQMTAGAKRRYMNEIYVFQVNQDKWKAAKQLADKRDIRFRILTEKGLRKMGMKI